MITIMMHKEPPRRAAAAPPPRPPRPARLGARAAPISCHSIPSYAILHYMISC